MYAGTANKRFHPDEALYTTFARNAFVHGDWLLTSPLDKPPISIYANAISQALFGGIITDKGVYDLPIRVGEFVARIPNLFAGIITVALFIALERKLFSKKIPIGALCLIASPLFIGLSASAFTDSLMLMWVMGSWLAIERRQSFLSGFLLMVGFATKPQAIFFLPLLVMRGLWGHPPKNWLRFGIGMIIPLVSLLVWDASRGTTSVFALGQYNYPTMGLIYDADNWGSRLSVWLGYLFFGMNPFLLMLTFIIIILQLISTYYPHIEALASSPIESQTYMPSLRDFIGRRDAIYRVRTWAWGIVILFYSLLHIVLGIPLYDRYVLLIIPVIIFVMRRYLTLLAVVGTMIFSPLFAGISGRDFYLPDGEGLIIMLADEINALPFGAIVYDHWRGWELGYYLGAWSDKRRVYYPDPITQAEDSLNNPEIWTRYLVAPNGTDYEIWLSAMRDVGYTVTIYKDIVVNREFYFTERPSYFYIIFALEPPPR
jgi:hypothetical protein